MRVVVKYAAVQMRDLTISDRYLESELDEGARKEEREQGQELREEVGERHGGECRTSGRDRRWSAPDYKHRNGPNTPLREGQRAEAGDVQSSFDGLQHYTTWT